jgi:hypothetical protein
MWHNPSSLTNGGRFGNGPPALLARQAALGMFAAAWHCYTGGRPAELTRACRGWRESFLCGRWAWLGCSRHSRTLLEQASKW